MIFTKTWVKNKKELYNFLNGEAKLMLRQWLKFRFKNIEKPFQ
jgi:hypothetical protein